MWVPSFFISLLMLMGVPFHLALQMSKMRVALERVKGREEEEKS